VPEPDTAGDRAAAADPLSQARAALAAARAAATRNRPGARASSAAQAGSGRATGSAADPGSSSGPGAGTGPRTSSGARTASDNRAARTRRKAGRPGFPAQQTGADPQPLAAAIGGLLEDEGWTLAAATGSVFGRWAQIVGGDLAAHTTPERLTDGELTVAADSTAWATQLRLLSGQLVKRLNAELGDGAVLRVRVVGPVTSTGQPGQWRVRGGRGPRDTYG
jgi:predicted nucleic acid-binding Zn ribbon protein